MMTALRSKDAVVRIRRRLGRLGRNLVLRNFRLLEEVFEKSDLQGLVAMDRNGRPYPTPGFTVDVMASMNSQKGPTAALQ